MYRLIITVDIAYKASPSPTSKADINHEKTCVGSAFKHTFTSQEHFKVMIQNNKGIAIALISAERSEGT